MEAARSTDGTRVNPFRWDPERKEIPQPPLFGGRQFPLRYGGNRLTVFASRTAIGWPLSRSPFALAVSRRLAVADKPGRAAARPSHPLRGITCANLPAAARAERWAGVCRPPHPPGIFAQGNG